ncbi:hypothetical protein [Deinococcus roseus]|uniref:Uncharacterized protein n=1 Tax=Deinococcus roseus TaxID=392414 RepID=A0ABQ2DBN1_9DEIO|nr:hypothetical protein [Deinococcus roseus]GGJ51133.1 hypothetical protein GCM10008938_41450 [Deinococcus roseus]
MTTIATVFFQKDSEIDLQVLEERLQSSAFFKSCLITRQEQNFQILLPETVLYIGHVTDPYVAEEAEEIAEWFKSKLSPEQYNLVFHSNHRVEIAIEDEMVMDCFNEWLVCAEIVSELAPSVALQVHINEVLWTPAMLQGGQHV